MSVQGPRRAPRPPPAPAQPSPGRPPDRAGPAPAPSALPSPTPKAPQELQAQRAQLALLEQDCARLVNPDYARPFASLDDAVDRLLPYHVRRAALCALLLLRRWQRGRSCGTGDTSPALGQQALRVRALLHPVPQVLRSLAPLCNQAEQQPGAPPNLSLPSPPPPGVCGAAQRGG